MLTLVRASSRNPETLPGLPKSPPKAGERRAGPFARAADGLSRPFLAVAVASVANRPFDALSTSPAPGRQNLADEVDTRAHTEAGLELGRFFLVWGSVKRPGMAQPRRASPSSALPNRVTARTSPVV